jgi:hypothetical protein
MALLQTEKMIHEKSYEVSSETQNVFMKAGQEFSVLALANPALISGLSLLKSFSENRIEKGEREKSAIVLRSILSRALPASAAAPSLQPSTQHQLDQLFLKQLEELKHE